MKACHGSSSNGFPSNSPLFSRRTSRKKPIVLLTSATSHLIPRAGPSWRSRRCRSQLIRTGYPAPILPSTTSSAYFVARSAG